jgi:hypothetical protein
MLTKCDRIWIGKQVLRPSSTKTFHYHAVFRNFPLEIVGPMWKKALFTIALLTSFCLAGSAQLAEKASFFGGMTYQFIGLRPLGSPAPTYTSLYGLGMGMDYVLMHSNDVVSVGINPNVNACLQFSSYYGLSFFANAPVYLLARVGSGATPFNEQKFGLGAGIGGTYSYLFTTVNAGGSNNNFSTGFMNPGAIVEMSIHSRNSNYLFRFNWSLLKPTRNVEIGSNSYPVRMGVLGLGIFYTF